MKNSLLFLSLFLLYAFTASSQTIVGKEAESKIQGAKVIQYSERSSRPEFIEFSESSVYRSGVEDPAETIRKILNFTEEEQLIVFRQTKDDLGFTHTKYRQYYKHIPVEGAEYISHEKAGGLDCINGLTFRLNNVLTTPVLNEEAALKKAITHVGAKKYMWDNASLIAELREAFDNPAFNYDPKGTLVIYPTNNNFSEQADFRLAYKFDIYAEEPESRAYIFVDARSGKIIGTQERIHTADKVGTANTKYSGTRTITTDEVSPTSYRLKETGRGNGIETRNVKTGTSTAGAVDFTDTDNNWNNVNAAMDEAATDAHWATEMTYDYFKTVHNRNSIDDNGFKLLNYVHWDKNWFNASWNGQFMRYGDGNGGGPLTTVDIGGHEMVHGLTEHTASLVYQGESGALNESFSDIFGNAVEYFAKPTVAKWLMGEDIGAIRDMKNPNAFTDPDTYNGTHWASTSGGDNGGVHTNSGVQNYWFYVLTEGASGNNDNNAAYNVTGVGIDKAAKIAFRNLSVYLTSSSNYAAARTGALKAATDLYGNCSTEYIATADAWHAVGVGTTSGCSVAPVADFVASTTTSCDGTVKFTDKSTSAPTTWAWDFGDGQTASIQNPSHTYSSSGTFTVKLTATNAFGTDTETKNSFVTVNLLAAPTVTSAARCDSGIVNLSASASSGTLQWYTAATGGSLVNTGTAYSPHLTATTTFYVESSTAGATQKAGPADAAFGASSLFTASSDHGLLFNVLAPCIIKTVKVFAGAAGNRTIEVLTAATGGTVLKTTTVNIPAGESRVTLNFDLPVGNQYFIKISGGLVDLTRNSAGAVYPYTASGLVSITGSTASTAGYYYFFYDWEVQTAGCSSVRVPVIGTINPPPAKPTITAAGFVLSAPSGYTYQWYLNGSPIAGATGQTHIATVDGDYKVEIILSPGCSSLSDPYTITGVGVENLAALAAISLYPNPTKGVIYIKSPEIGNTINISVYSVIGDVVYKETYNTVNQIHKIDLSVISDGIYFVKLQIGSDFATIKIALNH